MKQIILLLLSVTAVSCSCSSEREAGRRGVEAAQNIIGAMPLSEMEFQKMLLDVRAEEYDYRLREQTDEADAYIEAFTDYMKQHSDSIADLLAL